MPLNPPQDYRKTEFTHRIGVAADRPAAADVLAGTLYFSTDTLVLERSDGSVWASYSPAGGSGGLAEQTTNNTGAQNNFDLDGSNIYLRCTGAAPVFSGFTVSGSAPSPGDKVIIECLGTTAKVTFQDTNSTAAHRIITPSASGQIVGVAGRMELIYDGVTDRWREELIAGGALIDHPFAAGDYTSDSGTWVVTAGDIVIDKFVQEGKILYSWATINTSTVTGTPNQLRKALPTGFNGISGTQFTPLQYGYDNNVFTPLVYSINSAVSTTYTRINRADFANFASSADLTWVYYSGHSTLID